MTIHRGWLYTGAFTLAACAPASPPPLPWPDDAVEWPAYGGDAGGSRWSALDQVNRGNVGALAVAWTYHTGETAPEYATARPTALEATPLMVDGTLYLSTPLGG